ncbi:hypothetical protein C1645_875859 [Glomus cerebriforme]|uniref:Uncharacterized protein n=1 Tax=Glomus cerebriforme TaxID=658196 RepID=A0A397T3R8_9GLOM|nr:hypothetical protein C1645_875859 [Glomus cerebriforme]
MQYEEISSLREENARLVVKVTGLEVKNAKFEDKNTKHNVKNVELKAEVVKLRDDIEETNPGHFSQGNDNKNSKLSHSISTTPISPPQTSVSNSSGEKLPDVEMSTLVTFQVNVPSTAQVSKSNKSRPPISILSDDPEE